MVKNNSGKRLKAFTLTELMVVLVIVGILVLLALPKLMPLITETYGKEAEIQLGHIHMLQEKHFMTKSKYSTDLFDIRYEQSKLITDGGNARYQIEIVDANPSGFVARATAVVDFDGDGVLNVWEIDQDKNLREVTRD